MNKILPYTLFLILFLLSINSFAQESACAFKLEEAEALYETGILDSIPSMLRLCIDDGFDNEELARAYKLLILTYLFEDNEEMAELTMNKFLRKFPKYELKVTDPVEFTYLYKSYQTIPVYSIGVIGGVNYTYVRIIEPYPISIVENEDYSGEYSVSGTNIQFGLQFKRYLTEEIEINLDAMYCKKSFKYEIEQLYSKTEYTENLSLLSFPLTGTYDFNFSVLTPYLRAGINVDYMFGAKADFLKMNTGKFPGEDLKETDIDILNDRNEINISAVVGGGLKYNIKKGYVMLDLRYQFGFMNNVNDDNRYINDLKWGSFGYVDDDFALNNFFVSVGYVYPFYQTKLNK